MLRRKKQISVPHIAAAFQGLADEHARLREPQDRPLTWRLIQTKRLISAEGGVRERLAWALRLLLPTAAVLGAFALFLALRGPTTLELEQDGAVLRDGVLHAGARDATLSFSDGSRVQMLKGSAAQVELAGPHAARARLAAGALEVDVQHERDTDYRFLAGPYEVRVVGTRFRVSWQPESKRFSLAMHEGKVRVLGPGFDRTVSGGESLELTPPSQALEQRRASDDLALTEPRPRTNADPSETRSLARSELPAASAPGNGASDAAELARSAPSKPSDGLGWAALVAKGRFGEVVSAAQAAGTERSLRERGAAELSALAHAAHYTGNSALAVTTWTTLRERFAGQKPAHQAAFFLGRVYDQQGNGAQALRWLNAYLAEAPRDVYASEALGRKLSVVQKVEGSAAARRVAREYLDRFPKGAYAATARTLLAD